MTGFLRLVSYTVISLTYKASWLSLAEIYKNNNEKIFPRHNSANSGSNSAKIAQSGHASSPIYSLMKSRDYQRHDCERLLRKMVLDGILREELVIGAHDQALCYAKVGPKAFDVLSGRTKVSLSDSQKKMHDPSHQLNRCFLFKR